MIIINATKFDKYIRAIETIIMPKPVIIPCSYKNPTIKSVIADMISKIEPKLIITEGRRVLG